MVLAYQGNASAEATTLTLPTHQAGDLLIMAAFRDGSTSPATLPAGWISIGNCSTQSASNLMVAWRIAASAAESSGTWTSATLLCCAAYRDTTLHALDFGVTNRSASSTTVTYPAKAIITTSRGASDNAGIMTEAEQVVIGIAAAETKVSGIEVAPSGMTNRVMAQGASVGSIAFHDTSTEVTSWASTNVTVSPAIAYATFVVCATTLSFAWGGGSGGSRMVNVRGGADQ